MSGLVEKGVSLSPPVVQDGDFEKVFAPCFIKLSLLSLQFQMMTGNFIVLKGLGIGLP